MAKAAEETILCTIGSELILDFFPYQWNAWTCQYMETFWKSRSTVEAQVIAD
jgi:hypothetical protein